MFAVSRPASVAIGDCIPPASFAEQDLARRQAGQRLDAVGVDRAVAQDAAGDRHDLVRPGCVDHRLGRGGLVVAEGDRRRTDEQRAERLADRVLGGDPHQAVLHDAVAHVLLAQGATDLRDLRDGEAAVLGGDQRPAPGQRLAQLGDRLLLGLGGHAALLLRAHGRCAAVARRGPETTTPLRRRLFGWPDTQGRCHRKGGSHWSCLGVLTVVPGAPGAPIRSGGSSPDRHPVERDRGPRAQAVSGCPVVLRL